MIGWREWAWPPLVAFAWLFLLGAMLFGCGGAASDRAEEPFGWCCEGFCGLSARDSEYFAVCECAGIETGGNGVGRGECVEPLTE